MAPIKIKTLGYREIKENDKERIKKLLEVFLKQGEPIEDADVERTLKSEGNTLIAAFNEAGNIVGICDLLEVHLFLGKTGIIDEVVVDARYRGQGVATKLLEKAIDLAKDKGMRHLKLDTTADSPANRLYEKVGFVKKKDNIYKLYLM